MTLLPFNLLASETDAEGVHVGSAHESPPQRARHSFKPSPNPRTTSCAQCGRGREDTIHAYLELAHRAAVEGHLIRAQRAAHEGDMTEAIREAGIAVRLAQEEGL